VAHCCHRSLVDQLSSGDTLSDFTGRGKLFVRTVLCTNGYGARRVTVDMSSREQVYGLSSCLTLLSSAKCFSSDTIIRFKTTGYHEIFFER
jgi:hypothetical protein